MDDYQLIATISLVTQIVVLVLLFASIWLKVKKKYRQHGIMMFTAVVLHTVVILAWMVPTFSSIFSYPIALNAFLIAPILVAIFVHAFMGVAAVILGFWLVASWRLQVDVKACFAKKKAMRITLTLWLITMVLGIIMYLKITMGF